MGLPTFLCETGQQRRQFQSISASLASSRFDEDDHLIDASPIPETKDGFLYFYMPGKFGEYMTIEEAKAAADAEPWGPVKWEMDKARSGVTAFCVLPS